MATRGEEPVRPYPRAGETYDSYLYSEHKCRVMSVVDARVTFKWLPPYQYIDEQTAPVNQFVRDFSLSGKPDLSLEG